MGKRKTEEEKKKTISETHRRYREANKEEIRRKAKEKYQEQKGQQ